MQAESVQVPYVDVMAEGEGVGGEVSDQLHVIHKGALAFP
jgi:hypothetical protein